MRKKCPVCNGLGKVPKSYPSDTAMSYCGPDGEGWPHEICQNCNGEKWVGMPDIPSPTPKDPQP